MGSVIIAMPKKENAETIAGILRTHGIQVDAVCSYGAEILNVIGTRDGGIVLCSAKLKDMAYVELMDYLPDCFEMLLMTKNPEEVYIESERFGIVEMPLKASFLLEKLETVLSRIDSKYKKKKAGKRQRSPEEQRIIEEAKALLYEKKHMTEPEAFRYIQKCSMDTSRTMVESAKMILTLFQD